jgi:hypothetical protein
VSSLSPRPESHDDEDGRDSIERVIARYGEQSNLAIAVISCWTRLFSLLNFDQRRCFGLEGQGGWQSLTRADDSLRLLEGN